MDLNEVTAFVTELGRSPSGQKQLYEWMHKKLAPVPGGYDKSAEGPFGSVFWSMERIRPWRRSRCWNPGSTEPGNTCSAWGDGNIIEKSVLMKYKHGNSVCISSQVGCRMGCRFCASTLDGLDQEPDGGRDAGPDLRIQASTGERVSNVVVMGSGEPFDNYDSLVKFIRLLSDENGLNISQRNITVSTCGIVPGIRNLRRRAFL